MDDGDRRRRLEARFRVNDTPRARIERRQMRLVHEIGDEGRRRPAAADRSHAPDVSRAVGHRRQLATSASARCAGRSSSGTKPVRVVQSSSAERARLGAGVVVRRLLADEQQVQDRAGADARAAVALSRAVMRFSGVTPPNAATTSAPGAMWYRSRSGAARRRSHRAGAPPDPAGPDGPSPADRRAGPSRRAGSP